jgi:hypothetical protein
MATPEKQPGLSFFLNKGEADLRAEPAAPGADELDGGRLS